MREIKIQEIFGTKSYKSVATMEKALTKYNIPEARYIVYTFPSGRVTPVFVGVIPETLAMIHHGYYVVG